MSLTAEQKALLLDQKVAVTTGWGTGIGMSLLVGFMPHCLVSVDSSSVMLTDEEIALVLSYQDFVLHRFYRGPSALTPGKPVPMVEGHNTVILLKGPDWASNGPEGWAYRRMTWSVGPSFIPCRETTQPIPPPWTLQQALDHLNHNFPPKLEGDGKKWREWMAEHPDVFAREAAHPTPETHAQER